MNECLALSEAAESLENSLRSGASFKDWKKQTLAQSERKTAKTRCSGCSSGSFCRWEVIEKRIALSWKPSSSRQLDFSILINPPLFSDN